MFIRGPFIYGAAIPVGGEDMAPHIGHGLLVKAGIGWMF
jgi:hypothetical protein